MLPQVVILIRLFTSKQLLNSVLRESRTLHHVRFIIFFTPSLNDGPNMYACCVFPAAENFTIEFKIFDV